MMLKSPFRTLAAAVAFFGAAAPGLAAERETRITAFQWEKRVLIISEPRDEERLWTEQATFLAEDQAGLAERRLVWALVRADDLLIMSPGEGDAAPELRIESGGGEAERAAWDMPDDAFAVALVGLDGGVKARWDAPVSAKELFAVIDAMPMRQEEIRRKDTERDALRQDFEGR